MSYRAEISFKQIPAKDVFAFLKEFKDWVKNSIHEIAEDNFMYCPTVRWLHRSYADLNDAIQNNPDTYKITYILYEIWIFCFLLP